MVVSHVILSERPAHGSKGESAETRVRCGAARFPRTSPARDVWAGQRQASQTGGGPVAHGNAKLKLQLPRTSSRRPSPSPHHTAQLRRASMPRHLPQSHDLRNHFLNDSANDSTPSPGFPTCALASTRTVPSVASAWRRRVSSFRCGVGCDRDGIRRSDRASKRTCRRDRGTVRTCTDGTTSELGRSASAEKRGGGGAPHIIALPSRCAAQLRLCRGKNTLYSLYIRSRALSTLLHLRPLSTCSHLPPA